MKQEHVFIALGVVSALVLLVGLGIWLLKRWRHKMNEVSKLYREIVHAFVTEVNRHPTGEELDILWKKAMKNYKKRK
jgi:hypothetical protein